MSYSNPFHRIYIYGLFVMFAHFSNYTPNAIIDGCAILLFFMCKLSMNDEKFAEDIHKANSNTNQ